MTRLMFPSLCFRHFLFFLDLLDMVVGRGIEVEVGRIPQPRISSYDRVFPMKPSSLGVVEIGEQL
jgi:hypothetical protein